MSRSVFAETRPGAANRVLVLVQNFHLGRNSSGTNFSRLVDSELHYGQPREEDRLCYL